MTWTYGGDPAANDRDAVRWLVGDTDSTNQLASDEEIAYALSTFGAPLHAAAAVCEAIAGKFSSGSLTSKKVGSLSLGYQSPVEAFNERARSLRLQIGRSLSEIFVGGLSIDDKEALADDDDAVQPAFSRGQDDYPGTRDRGYWPKKYGDE